MLDLPTAPLPTTTTLMAVSISSSLIIAFSQSQKNNTKTIKELFPIKKQVNQFYIALCVFFLLYFIPWLTLCFI